MSNVHSQSVQLDGIEMSNVKSTQSVSGPVSMSGYFVFNLVHVCIVRVRSSTTRGTQRSPVPYEKNGGTNRRIG
jgi:hypothetical protein